MSIDRQKLNLLLQDLQRLKATKENGALGGLVFDLANKIQGFKGENGYTPQKGIYYFTEEEVNQIIDELSKKITEIIQARIRMPKDGKDGYTPIKGVDYFDGRNGKDAVSPDPRKIAQEASTMAVDAIKPQIPTIEQIEADLPKLGAEIRDSLELIVKEDDKLKIDAIGFLREELDKLRQLRTQVLGGGGGMSKIALNMAFVDNETPTGTIDGANKDFVLAHVPSPAASLKVYLNGQRMKLTDDYTYTAATRTISFVSAPLTGNFIFCDYRV